MNYTLCLKLEIMLWKTDAHVSKKLKEPIEWRKYLQIIHIGLVSRTYKALLLKEKKIFFNMQKAWHISQKWPIFTEDDQHQ